MFGQSNVFWDKIIKGKGLATGGGGGDFFFAFI